MLQKAASAVFTFLVSNPDNEVMQENLKFYSNLPEVDMHQVVNLEARVRQRACYPLKIMTKFNVLYILYNMHFNK
jgi:hypothetical protein